MIELGLAAGRHSVICKLPWRQMCREENQMERGWPKRCIYCKMMMMMMLLLSSSSS